MRRSTVIALAVVGIAVLVAAFAADQPKVRIRANATDVLAADMEFAKVTAEKGLDGWLSFFAKDATIFPRKGPAIQGLPAIVEYYRKTGWTPEGLTWQPQRASISDSGDLGYTWGLATWKGKDAQGKPVSGHGKYLTVWRKQSDGSWKVVADIGSMDLD